jgi:hypothetical protein
MITLAIFYLTLTSISEKYRFWPDGKTLEFFHPNALYLPNLIPHVETFTQVPPKRIIFDESDPTA